MMDPVTHMLAGAAMAHAGLKDRFGRGAVTTMVLASELPDVDQLVLMFSGDPFYIASRRMLTHSVFGMPLLAAGAAWVFRRLYPHIPYPALFTMCLLACAVHAGLDLVNSFGVVLLYPLSRHRFELSSVFIIDLFLTGILAAPLLLALVPRLRRRLGTMSRTALVLAGAYIGVCESNRLAAAFMLRREAASSVAAPSFDHVFPEPFGPQRFRGVIREGDVYKVYLIEPIRNRLELKRTVRTRDQERLIRRAREHPEAQRLEWFYKAPVWDLVKDSDGRSRATVYDLRFTSLVMDRGRPFEAAFELDGKGEVVSVGWAPLGR